MNITPKLLSTNFTAGRAGHKVRAIVLHVSSGTEASAISWFSNPASKVSAHYLVCKDGRVLRFVSESDTAWGNGILNKPDLSHPLVKLWATAPHDPTWPAGLPNLETISIEREGQPGETIPALQWAAEVELVAAICQRHGLAPDRSAILGHYQLDSVDRPNCPGFDAATWSRLIGAVAVLGAPTPATEDERLEAEYQRITKALGAAHVGGKRFKAQLDRVYYVGPALVCDGAVVGQDAATTARLARGLIDDMTTTLEGLGGLRRV